MITGFAGIHHWIIATRDVDECIEFYTKLFGWKPLFDSEISGPEFSETVGIPNAQARTAGGLVGRDLVEFVSSSWSTDTTVDPARVGLSSFGVQVDDADTAYQECLALGVEVPNPPHDVQGTRIFFIIGPDGQKIEFCEFKTDETWDGVRVGS